MRNQPVTRRSLLVSMGAFVLAGSILEACSSSSPAAPAASSGSSSSSSSAPTTAASSSSAPTTAASSSAPSSAPTTASQPAQAAPSGGTVNLSLAVYAGANRDWMPKYAKIWATNNPNVKLRIDQIDYAQMATKSLAEFTSGTLQDVLFSGCKWLAYNAAKGMFAPIDSYTKQKDPGMDDFLQATIADSTYKGKLYGLPFEFNSGNINVIYYNKEMVQAKGAKEPTDNWTADDFTEFVTKLTDSSKGIWGTDIFPGSYYDLGCYARSFGGGVLNLPNFDKFTLTTDPNTVKATQWMVDLRTKYKAAPNRAESQNLSVMFPSQKLGSTASCICSFTSQKQSVANKFQYGVVLGPTGPTGGRGYDSFAAIWNMSAKTASPDLGYSLMMGITSKEAATWAVLNDDQPPARASVWRDPTLNKDNNIYQRLADWVTNGKDQGPFPIPANLRFSELQDKWANLSPALFYGEVDFNTGMQQIQTACEQIMQEPAP